MKRGFDLNVNQKRLAIAGIVLVCVVVLLLVASNFTGFVVSDQKNKSVDKKESKNKVKDEYEIVISEEEVVEEVSPEEEVSIEEEVVENVSVSEDAVEVDNQTEQVENVSEVENVSVFENVSVLGQEVFENVSEIENVSNVSEIENVSNVSEIENVSVVSEIENISVNESEAIVSDVIQYRAVINRPVKWLSKIKITKKGKVIIKLPKNARDIAVLTGEEIGVAEARVDKYEKVVNKSNRQGLAKGRVVTGNVVADIEQSEGILTKSWNWVTGFAITGKVILEEEIGGSIVREGEDTELDLEGAGISESEIGVEYYTDAPISEEENTVDGKKITVSAADEFGYENVLAYTELFPEIEEEKIEFYHVVNGTRVPVNFTAFDLNENGLIDYIEWNVERL